MEIIVGLAIFYLIGSFLWKAVKPMLGIINAPRNDTSTTERYTGRPIHGRRQFFERLYNNRKIRSQVRILILPGIALLVGAVTALGKTISTGDLAHLGTMVVSLLLGLILLAFGLAPYLLPDEKPTNEGTAASPPTSPTHAAAPQPATSPQKKNENQFTEL